MSTADAPLPDPPPPMTETSWPEENGNPAKLDPGDDDPAESEDGEEVDYDGHAGAGPF